jgi:2-phospho-L-lactate guanylyltransferase
MTSRQTIRDTCDAWAIVPVKDLASAKGRLAQIMEPRVRALLVRAMLFDVLAALSGVMAGTLVVTNDPQAASLARQFQARVELEEPGGDLNSALAQGLRILGDEGRRNAVIIPADVPAVTPAELQEVLLALERRPVVLTRACRDGGTNLLAMTPPGLIAPCFGPRSLARHLAAARALDIEPVVLNLAGLRCDIDVEGDLETLGAGLRGTRTAAVLGEIMNATTEQG